VERFPKLSETFILNQVTYLLKAGHVVDVFPVGRTEEKDMHQDIHQLRLLRRTFYPPIVPQNKIWAWLKFTMLVIIKPALRPVVKLLKSQDFYRKQDLLHRLYLISLVYPFSPKKKYDIIHCHFGPTGLRAVFIASLGLMEGKMVTTFYGYDITHKAMGENYYLNLFNNCEKFIVISNYIREKAAKMGFDRDKMEVLPIGVNTNVFIPATRKMENKSIRLLSVARLVEKKKGCIIPFRLIISLLNIIRIPDTTLWGKES